MLHDILYKPFAVYPQAAQSIQAMIESALLHVKSGAVDDAERSGLNIQKLGSLAVVSSKGAIVKEAGWLSDWGFTGLKEAEVALKSAAIDDDIESVLWVIDSPGGSVDGLSQFADIVDEVASVKPLHVQVDGMLASAAVYMSAGASKIYANRRDLVGSIGTRIQLFDYSQAFKEAGIKSIVIDTGEHKSAGAMGEEITENQIEEFQRIVDGYFSDFKEQVLKNRPIDEKVFNQLADGRVFFADEEPIKYGLIDGIGTVQQTISSIMKPSYSRRKTAAQARLKMLDF